MTYWSRFAAVVASGLLLFAAGARADDPAAPAAAPATATADPPHSIMLDGVTVKSRVGRPPDVDENFHRARDLIAQYGTHPLDSQWSQLTAALAQRFSLLPITPPQASEDLADRADAIAHEVFEPGKHP